MTENQFNELLGIMQEILEATQSNGEKLQEIERNTESLQGSTSLGDLFSELETISSRTDDVERAVKRLKGL